MKDKYNLQRFVSRQNVIYEDVIKELENGRKVSCWMWYIFPQVKGLGSSTTDREFSIKSGEEAKAYLDHPLLGERLKQCTQVVIEIEGLTANEIFGYPDYLKFKSCMSLFSVIERKGNIFETALSKYYEGETDDKTLRFLESV